MFSKANHVFVTGLVLGLLLQWTCVCTGLLVVAILCYAVYKSSQFHGWNISPDGKAVLITGCDSGFGKHTAEILDTLGYKVFAGCLFPQKGGADDLRRKCSSKLHLFRLDVTSDEEVTKALEYVNENLGEDVLWSVVNNAGIAEGGEVEWTPISVYERLLNINVLGVARVTKAFLPLIRKSKGRVVNVASLAGRFALSGFSAYCVSKHACIAFSDSLRREMRKFGVTVHTVEPGFYKTEMTNVDYQLSLYNRTWEHTPDDIKEAYTDDFFRAFLDNAVKILTEDVNPHPEEAVHCIVDAVTSKKPKINYVPNFKALVRAGILRSVPTFVQDILLRAREPRFSFVKEE